MAVKTTLTGMTGFSYSVVPVGVKGQSLLNKDLVMFGLNSTTKKREVVNAKKRNIHSFIH